MTVREYAEKILLSTRLEDKLAAPPVGLKLDPPSRGSYQAPSLPGRPESLLPRRPSETRTKLPSAELLSSEEHRSVLLHFFCNHELIAVELMALALLKFPDAPDAFRRGLLHTLQEEQEHTRLYMNRMAETGTTFGDHSLSRMIWDHISTMDSPLEYVSRLSLTFEQSNLDFAHHYSKAFHKVGDEKSSQLLAKIYHDEIAHVGYGLKWLRQFKEEKQSDWDAWHNALARPLTPIRAKAPEGNIPFNEEARRKAGLDDDFIKNLLLYNRSRGRTPHVHYFNPNCEAHILAELNGKNFQPNKNDRHLEEDLEALIIANAHHDDMVLLRKEISSEHLASLKGAGLPLPEIITDTTPLATRKLGGFRPWAWSPDSSKLFQPFADNPTPNSLHPWEQSYPALFYSKELTSQLSQSLELSNKVKKKAHLKSSSSPLTPALVAASFPSTRRLPKSYSPGGSRIASSHITQSSLSHTCHVFSTSPLSTRLVVMAKLVSRPSLVYKPMLMGATSALPLRPRLVISCRKSSPSSFTKTASKREAKISPRLISTKKSSLPPYPSCCQAITGLLQWTPYFINTQEKNLRSGRLWRSMLAAPWVVSLTTSAKKFLLTELEH